MRSACGRRSRCLKGFESIDDIRRLIRTIFGCLFEELEEELGDAFGQTGAHVVFERRRFFRALHVEQLARRSGVKWGFAREQFVKHEAERVQIGAVIDGARIDLFWAHVLEGSDTLRVGLVHGLEHFGNAEVHDLHGAVLEDHDIFGLEITMNDGRLLTVCCRKRGCDRRNDAHGFGPGLSSVFEEDVAQGSSFEKFEDHGELAVGFDAGQTPDDVGMFEMREDLHLVDEELASRVALGELRMEDFDRDAAFGELFFALVDFAHAPLAHQPPDEVITELLHHVSPIRRATYVRAPVSTYTICDRFCEGDVRAVEGRVPDTHSRDASPVEARFSSTCSQVASPVEARFSGTRLPELAPSGGSNSGAPGERRKMRAPTFIKICEGWCNIRTQETHWGVV